MILLSVYSWQISTHTVAVSDGNCAAFVSVSSYSNQRFAPTPSLFPCPVLHKPANQTPVPFKLPHRNYKEKKREKMKKHSDEFV